MSTYSEWNIKCSQVLLLGAIPGVSLPASESIHGLSIPVSAVLIFLTVQFVSMIGYFAASLSDWAVWNDDSGTPLEQATRRLKLVQGMIVGILTGNVCFYGGTIGLSAETLTGFITAGLGAYGGDRVLTPILQRIIGK